jgi:hypothetical protein
VSIYYTGGYKYQLSYDYGIHTGILGYSAAIEYLSIYTTGELIIEGGYAWDGPSGPTFDTKTFMRGSLVHDALYQLIREGIIPLEDRVKADDLLKQICKDDGMNPLRAWWVHKGVTMLGKNAALSENTRVVEKAP